MTKPEALQALIATDPNRTYFVIEELAYYNDSKRQTTSFAVSAVDNRMDCLLAKSDKLDHCVARLIQDVQDENLNRELQLTAECNR